MKELEESYIQAHSNEYWTRIIALEDFLPNVQDRFPIGPDLAYEMDNILRIDAATLPDWEAEFDPISF